MLLEKPQHFPVGEEEKGYEGCGTEGGPQRSAVLPPAGEALQVPIDELHGSGPACPSLTSGA